jgi:hypothetical protein
VFAQVLSILGKEGLIGREMFAIDGVKLPSNASKHRSGTRAEFLARAGSRRLERWRLVQQPVRERYALHAVVRYAVARRTKPAADRVCAHYVMLLERHPERLEFEQSHLFAAMEHASRKGDMNALLRIDALARRLGE